MSTVAYLWMVALAATMWLVPYTVVRVVAYRSGEVDHTPGMRKVATFSAVLAVVAVGSLVVLTVLLLAE